MYKDSIQSIRNLIFPIFQFGAKLNYGVLGTGFFIDEEGHFLTAAHVIDALPEKSVLSYLGNIPDTSKTLKNPVPIKIINKDGSKDLALGKIEHRILPPVPFAPEAAKVGESITLCGYPFPNIKKTSEVRTGNKLSINLDVSQVRQYWQPTVKIDIVQKGTFYRKSFDSFITQDASLPGMSGGPIFNLSGELVGVTSANATRQIPRNKFPLTIENGIGVELSEVKLFIDQSLSYSMRNLDIDLMI